MFKLLIEILILAAILNYFGVNVKEIPQNVNDYAQKVSVHKIEINTSQVVDGLKDVKELATARFEYEEVGQVKDTYYLSEKNLIMKFRGIIRYGYDLEKVKAEDIVLKGDVLQIKLPAPEILSNELDLSQTKTLTADNGFWNRIHPDDVLKIQENGKKEAEKRALANENFKKSAETNAKNAIESVINKIDSRIKVEITH